MHVAPHAEFFCQHFEFSRFIPPTTNKSVLWRNDSGNAAKASIERSTPLRTKSDPTCSNKFCCSLCHFSGDKFHGYLGFARCIFCPDRCRGKNFKTFRFSLIMLLEIGDLLISQHHEFRRFTMLESRSLKCGIMTIT